MGCEEDGEKETRKAKADGKVDEEDGEEDDEIHTPPVTGLRWWVVGGAASESFYSSGSAGIGMN
jgi:hypothetical protein